MSGDPNDQTGKPFVNPAVVAFYWRNLRSINKAARRCGYAIGLHGSLSRDLDLVAVPWTKKATSAEALIEAIRKVTGTWESPTDPPADRPHGRRTWCLHFGQGPYLDISVMPRSKPESEETTDV